MNHSWRAIQRVGENMGLTKKKLDTYLKVATDVHEEKLQSASDRYDLDSDYFDFLREQVFNDERIISVLRDFDISSEYLEEMQSAELDVSSVFREYWKVNYGLDELVDLVFILKFFNDYSQISGDTFVSHDRIQYLAYLTNNRLTKREDYSAAPQKTDLGMLERTGYRYTFRKADNRIYSSRLSQDLNRLVASELLDEVVNDEINPNEHKPFSLSLGPAGEFITTRYSRKFRQMNSIGSPLLREWNSCQKEIIRKWRDAPLEDLESYVFKLNSFDQKRNGSVLLTGRTRLFDNQDEIISDIIQGVQKAHV